MKIKFITTLLLTGLILEMGLALPAKALEKNQLFSAKNEAADFVVRGGKEFINMNPGETVTKSILFTNRLGKEAAFNVNVEDFTGSSEGTAELGSGTGDFSLKDYLKTEVTEVTLKDMEQAKFYYTVSLPETAKPGGLFGSVVITPKDPVTQTDANGVAVKVETAIAYLVFVRVNGVAIEEGSMTEFNTDKKFYEYGPVKMTFGFENHGNVHLLPSGKITVKNMLGKAIGDITIPSYYTIPNTVRSLTMDFNRKHMFGKYTATIELSRAYTQSENIIDTKTVTFWVIPWKIVLIVVAIIILVLYLLSSYLSKFKISKA